MNHLMQLPRRQAKTVLASAAYLPTSVGQVALAASDYPATVLDASLQDLSEVIFCKNTSGGTLPVGTLLVRDSAEEPLGYGVKKAPVSQHPATIVGVVPEGLVDGDGAAVTAVADGAYFFAVRKGNVKVLTRTGDDVTINLGVIVNGTAAGAADEAAATTGAACGYWLASGTGPALTLARISAQG
jgi:hypothetical protein